MSGLGVFACALAQAVGPPAGEPPSAPDSADTRAAGVLYQSIGQQITIGAMARQQAGSRDVRVFGDRLLRDEVQADMLLRQYIRAHAIRLPEPADAREKQAQRARLLQLRGAEFDREFLARALAESERALAELLPLRAQVSDPSLRDLVGRLVPIFEQHRQLARELLEKAWPAK